MADRRRFRLGVIAQEAVRTVVGQPALGAVALGSALLAGLLVPALTAADVGAIESAAAERVLAGSTVLTISAKDRLPLPANRCDALRSVSGVVGAGGVTSSATVPSADGLSVTLVTATPGYAEVVWPGDSLRRDMPRSAVAGVLLASRAGLDGPGTLAGLVVAGETRSAQIDQVAAASPRMSFLDRAVVLAEPASGTVVECLVEADDQALAGVEAIAVSWFPAEYETTTAPFDPTLGQERELDTRLAERLSAAGPPLGAVLSAMGIGATWLARRRDLALYRSLGLSSPRLALALAVETALQTGVGLLIGVGAAAVVLPWTPLALQLATSDVGALLALAALIPLVGLGFSPRGRGLAAMRGR
ncbi:hypothetical protein GSU68_12565 [Rathayibacter sp. VKM Ac-2759]|uniref:hypothetical protein n=1 Tax=Rathayibacter sp. VKM Ac-2759 TaxID=2609252 RepID=UPI0013182703|nr:hypothetical protein [Rathayibacter sp. VKM Ac-2759]QHC67313.1 hypothetical protein GSU68_12565 [Rathayibacter sp. VKM Ac-2759]